MIRKIILMFQEYHLIFQGEQLFYYLFKIWVLQQMKYQTYLVCILHFGFIILFIYSFGLLLYSHIMLLIHLLIIINLILIFNQIWFMGVGSMNKYYYQLLNSFQSFQILQMVILIWFFFIFYQIFNQQVIFASS